MIKEKMGDVAIGGLSSAEQHEPSIAEIELEGLRLQAAGEFQAAVKNFRTIHERENSGVSLSHYCQALAIAGDIDELNRVALSADLRNFNSSPWTYLHDLSVAERRIFLEVLMVVCQSPEAIISLCRAVQYIVENDIRGDFVECGVYKGASAICIIRMLQEFGIHDRKVWLYDTFAGMPKPEAVDRYCDTIGVQEDPDATWTRLKRDDGSGGSDWVYSSFDEVKMNVIRTGYPEENIVFVKGMVEETIPLSAPERISLLRLDTDFYRSTHHELVHLYPSLVPGGVLIIDDYGAFQGARKATDEYIRQNNLRLFLSRIDEHVRLAIKPWGLSI